MLLIDNLLTAPLMWIAREISEAAQKEQSGQTEAITLALAALYQRLEKGEISEQEFERQESELLDRLDALEAAREHEHGPA